MLIENLINYGKAMAAHARTGNHIPTPAVQTMLEVLHTVIVQQLGDFAPHLQARWQRQLPLLENDLKLLAVKPSLPYEHVTRMLNTILSPLALLPKQQAAFASLVCMTLAEQLAKQGNRSQSAIFSGLASKYQHKAREELLPLLEQAAICSDFCASGLSDVTPENLQPTLSAWLQELPPDLAPSVADFFAGLQRTMDAHAQQPHVQATIFHALCGTPDDMSSSIAIRSSLIASNDPHAVTHLAARLPQDIQRTCEIKLDPVTHHHNRPIDGWIRRIEISDASTIRDLAGVASDAPLTAEVTDVAVAELNRLVPALAWQATQQPARPTLVPGQHLFDLYTLMQQEPSVKTEVEHLLKKLQPTLAVWLQQSPHTAWNEEEPPQGPSLR